MIRILVNNQRYNEFLTKLNDIYSISYYTDSTDRVINLYNKFWLNTRTMIEVELMSQIHIGIINEIYRR